MEIYTHNMSEGKLCPAVVFDGRKICLRSTTLSANYPKIPKNVASFFVVVGFVCIRFLPLYKNKQVQVNENLNTSFLMSNPLAQCMLRYTPAPEMLNTISGGENSDMVLSVLNCVSVN